MMFFSSRGYALICIKKLRSKLSLGMIDGERHDKIDAHKELVGCLDNFLFFLVLGIIIRID